MTILFHCGFCGFHEPGAPLAQARRIRCPGTSSAKCKLVYDFDPAEQRYVLQGGPYTMPPPSTDFPSVWEREVRRQRDDAEKMLVTAAVRYAQDKSADNFDSLRRAAFFLAAVAAMEEA